MNRLIYRGEVYWVDFNPSIGGEIQKTRPAIIVSNNYCNKFLNRVQVVPITSNKERCYPCETIVSILEKEGKAMADQLMTISKKRLKDKICNIKESDMEKVSKIIMTQLNLR